MASAPAEIQIELHPAKTPPPIVGDPQSDEARTTPRWYRRWPAATAAVMVVVVALTVAALKVTDQPRAAHRPDLAGAYGDDPAARHTFEVAAFELSERTAASLSAAEDSFRQLANRYPDRAPAWSGLAEVYILEREFGALSDSVAFPMAERADNAALALDPDSAGAWLDKGYVAWWWKGDATTAFNAFQRAIQLDPGWARAYHWYATALENHGDFAKSLETIAQARRLDPESRAIMADEGVIQFDCGKREQGLATLEKLAQNDPQFVSWHQYLMHAYLLMGRDAEFLRESITVARLRGQTDVETGLHVVQERLRQGGRTAMLDALTDVESNRIASGSGSALRAAQLRSLAHDKTGMLKWLTVSKARHEQGLASVELYLEFAAYRQDPDFRRFIHEAVTARVSRQ